MGEVQKQKRLQIFLDTKRHVGQPIDGFAAKLKLQFIKLSKNYLNLEPNILRTTFLNNLGSEFDHIKLWVHLPPEWLQENFEAVVTQVRLYYNRLQLDKPTKSYKNKITTTNKYKPTVTPTSTVSTPNTNDSRSNTGNNPMATKPQYQLDICREIGQNIHSQERINHWQSLALSLIHI